MRRYKYLHFQSGVDWQDVSPTLLSRLNRLGMNLGKVITITSGYRSPDVNRAVGGAAHSHHMTGQAVDATINGTPLGSAVKEKTLARYGLYSGNRPGFFHGKPDPAHIETLEERGGKYSGNAPTASSAPADSAPSPSVPQYLPPGSPPQPEETVPGIYAPGSASADFAPSSSSDIWQLIASQPLASPESQSYAERAKLASTGTG